MAGVLVPSRIAESFAIGSRLHPTMPKALASTLSFTSAFALIALVGFSGSALSAIEPQDVPAKPSVATATADSSAGHSAKSKSSKHHKHHHHKGQAGRKQSWPWRAASVPPLAARWGRHRSLANGDERLALFLNSHRTGHVDFFPAQCSRWPRKFNSAL